MSGGIGDLHTEPGRPQHVTATVTKAPASFSDSLKVHIPSFGPGDWGPCPWTPHGGTLPTVGTQCLVVQDENEQWWVVAWIGGWTDVVPD